MNFLKILHKNLQLWLFNFKVGAIVGAIYFIGSQGYTNWNHIHLLGMNVKAFTQKIFILKVQEVFPLIASVSFQRLALVRLCKIKFS